ncbi:MAG: hypothetical protein IKS65_01055 [Bacteroidales bacterium]|nr:hypothetical protein [Bacteroidales bacterium]
MKKVFILIVGLMLTMTAFAQKTVAVYVTASESVSQDAQNILSSQLVSAITKSPDYIALERTSDFLEQISVEKGKYDNIDDNKLFDIGERYGASNVCVANITKLDNEYYIEARLLDIKTSKVWKTAEEYCSSIKEFVAASKSLANILFGRKKEFSTYAYGDNIDNKSFIIKIENRENFTIVTLKYVTVDSQHQLGIRSDTYIEDMSTHRKYQLIDATNIIKLDQNHNVGKKISGIWEYHLSFERIPEDVQNIMIVEPNGCKYNNIVLRPYGEDNVFVFEDNTQQIYDNMLKELEEEQQRILSEKIFIHKNGSSYYFGDKRLSRREYKDIIEDCPEAWAKYKKGKTWNTVGWACALGGVAIFVVSLNENGYGGDTSLDKFEKQRAMIRFTAVGFCLISIPQFIIGNYNKREAYKEYNKHCAQPAKLSMGVTGNGLGIVYYF